MLISDIPARGVRAIRLAAIGATLAGLPLHAQAGVDSAKQPLVTIYPTFISRPETGFGAGIGGAFVLDGAIPTRPRAGLSVEALLAAHGRGSVTAAAERSDQSGTQRVSAWADASTLLARFDGIGQHAGIERRTYKPTVVQGGIAYEHTLWRALSAGPLLSVRHVSLDEVSKDVLTRENLVGAAGGTTVATGLLAKWDTRDEAAATRGALLEVSATHAGSWAGGDFTSHRVVVDARRYFPLTPTAQLAVQLVGDLAGGQVPFDQLAMSGERGIMRAYEAAGLRDRNLVDAQAEVRWRPWSRLGLVGFGGAGTMADRARDLRLGDLLPSVGWGIRFHPRGSDRLVVRLDRGYGHHTAATTIGIGEAY